MERQEVDEEGKEKEVGETEGAVPEVRGDTDILCTLDAPAPRGGKGGQ